MRINGIDARTFKSKQLTVEFQPPSTAVKYDWNDGDLKPNAYETEEKAGKLTLVMYFVAKDRTEVMRCISEFLMHTNGEAQLELEGYKGTFRGIKQSAKIDKTLEHRKKKLEIVFDGFFIDSSIEKVLKKESQTYITQGTRKSPCTLRMKNLTEEAQTVAVEGLTETAIQAEVPAGKTLVIDGELGLVTIDGENAFLQVIEMWEFPYVPQGEVTVNVTNVKNVQTTMSYKPMWI